MELSQGPSEATTARMNQIRQGVDFCILYHPFVALSAIQLTTLHFNNMVSLLTDAIASQTVCVVVTAITRMTTFTEQVT